jgi:hypothetical protein
MAVHVLNYFGGGLNGGLPGCLTQRFPTGRAMKGREEALLIREMDVVLRRRRAVDLGDWLDEQGAFDLAGRLGKAIGDFNGWPADKFYPADEFAYLVFPDLTPIVFGFAVERSCGFKWRFEDTLPFMRDGRSFREVVEELRRRKAAGRSG